MKFSDLLGSENEEQQDTQDMKATDLLRRDHDRVRELFAQFRSMKDEDAGDAEKQELFRQIDRELTVHSRAEEEIFYPAVKKAPADDAKDMVLEAREEHGIVDVLLGQLRGMRPKDESFDAKMTVLMENVEHHADEEENEIFPAAEELGERTLDRLGKQIAQRKTELESEVGRARRGRSGRATSRATSSRSPSRAARGGKRAARTTAKRSTAASRAKRSAPASRAKRSSTARRSASRSKASGSRASMRGAKATARKTASRGSSRGRRSRR